MELTIRDDVGLTTWGSGSSSGGDPINTYYHGSRAQFIVLASELSVGGAVVSLSLYINQLPGRANLQNFRIRIKHTSATTTTAWEGDWTDCFGPTNVAKGDLTTGEWNKFVFGTDFEWNGTDNLLIDISRDDTGWSSSGGMMRRMIDESDRMYAGQCHNCTLYADTSGTTSGWKNDFIPAIKLEIEVESVDAGRFALESTFAIDSGTRAKTTEPFAAQSGLSGTLWIARLDVGALQAGGGLVGGGLYLSKVEAGRFGAVISVSDTEFVREPWTPEEIPTDLWLDMADTSTLTLDGTYIDEWRDKSGNARHAYQSIEARRARYFDSYKLNGIKVARISNQWHGFELTNTAADIVRNVSKIVGYYVAATTGGTVIKPVFFASTPWSETSSAVFRMGAYYYQGMVTAAQSQHALTGNYTNNSEGYYLAEARTDFSDDPNYAYMRINGDPNIAGSVSFDDSAFGGSPPPAGASHDLDSLAVHIGFQSSSVGLVGQVAEIILFRYDPGEANREKIEGYLAHKWGLTDLLPLSHTYKEELPYPDLPPVIYQSDIKAGASLQGEAWLARIEAQHVGLSATLQGEPWLAQVVAEHFAIQGDTSGSPTNCFEAGRFTLDSELRMQDTYYGWIRDAGHNGAASKLYGDFHRIVWWQDPRPITAQQVYTCILTGHQDSTTDLALPMSSFQFRLYHHGGSYLSIVVPNAVFYAPQISARLGGQLVVRQGYRQSDGTEQLAEMARAGQITLRHDTGARNSSATIVAGETVQFSFDAGVVKKVTKLINRTLQADGNWQFRTPPIFGLFPGDAVEVDGQSWNVVRVSVAVGRNLQTMDILSDGPS